MTAEVLAGLTSSPRAILPKYFYDERGAALFEAITRLPEYYVTRTEMAIFDAHLPDVARNLGGDVCVVEYGSGSSLKIRKLFESLVPRAYVPVDISSEQLADHASRLHQDFPDIAVQPVCADFTLPLELPDTVEALPKLAFFPGSSIGNFEPADAIQFLHNIRRTVGEDGALLIGVDRKKPAAVLEQAYDDAQGVTAQFNLNVLSHLNRELGADFKPAQFTHVARYNQTLGCVQMFLRSELEQVVCIAGHRIRLRQGEEIHTENSFKYEPEEFLRMAGAAGFAERASFSDERGWFTVYLLV